MNPEPANQAAAPAGLVDLLDVDPLNVARGKRVMFEACARLRGPDPVA